MADAFFATMQIVGVGFLFRVGWAVAGSLVSWLGLPDPLMQLTIHNHTRIEQARAKEPRP